MSLLDKMRLYDGRMVGAYTRQDVVEMKRHHASEGMGGISPRYVMNRIGVAGSAPGIECLTPLAALDSLWKGMNENISLDQAARTAFITLVTDTIAEYNALAIAEIQRAFEDSFDDTASILLDSYLKSVRAYCSGAELDDEGGVIRREGHAGAGASNQYPRTRQKGVPTGNRSSGFTACQSPAKVRIYDRAEIEGGYRVSPVPIDPRSAKRPLSSSIRAPEGRMVSAASLDRQTPHRKVWILRRMCGRPARVCDSHSSEQGSRKDPKE